MAAQTLRPPPRVPGYPRRSVSARARAVVDHGRRRRSLRGCRRRRSRPAREASRRRRRRRSHARVRRRSRSTSAFATDRAGAGPAAGARGSTRPESARRRGRSSRATTRSRRGSGRRSRPGPTGRSRVSPVWRRSTRRARSSSSSSVSPSSGRGSRAQRTRGARRPCSSPTRRTRSRPGTSSTRSTRGICPIFVPTELGLLDRLDGKSPAEQLRTLRRWATHGVGGEPGDRPSPLRRRAAAPRSPAVGAARVRPGRRAGAERSRGARRRCRRAVRQGRPGRGVLAARAARAPLPQVRDRALPPRPAPALDRLRRPGEEGAAARDDRRSPARRSFAREAATSGHPAKAGR